MGDQEGPDRHGDPAHQAENEHRRGEQRQAVAEHQAGHRQHHQNKAKTQLSFQRHDFHQPGIEEDGDQNTGVQKGKGVAHTGNGQMEIIRNVTHHHPGDDHQRAGQGVGEEADPCELNTVAVSHDWPVNRKVKRVDAAPGGQILFVQVM